MIVKYQIYLASHHVRKLNFKPNSQGSPPLFRQWTRGRVKFVPLEKMQDALVLVMCNLKPAPLRNIMSFGMVAGLRFHPLPRYPLKRGEVDLDSTL